MQWNIAQPQKKNEITAFAAAWMGLEMIILSEVREKQQMISLTCGILKHDTNELTYNTEIESQTYKK